MLIYEPYQTLGKKEHYFNVGLVLGLEMEVFVRKRLALLLGGGPRLLLRNNPFGKIDYALTLGANITR